MAISLGLYFCISSCMVWLIFPNRSNMSFFPLSFTTFISSILMVFPVTLRIAYPMITVPGSTPKIILLFCGNRGYFWSVIRSANKSIKIFFKYLLGPLLFVWLAWTLLKQLQAAPDLDGQLKLLSAGFGREGFFLLVVVVLLMFFQWGIEALKWQLMLRPVVKVSLFHAIQTVFSGISFSLVTPNRFGEFAGRILHLPAGTRLQGTAYTFIGNLAQLIITCLAGFIALLVYQDEVRASLDQYGLVLTVELLLLFTPLFLLLLLFFFFGSSFIVGKLLKIPFLRRYEDQVQQLSSMRLDGLFALVFLSAVRYFIFIVQYWILFQFSSIHLSFELVFGYVSVMFLWLAIVPTFSMLELGLRWQFALVLFSPLTSQALGIAFVVTAVWLVNFMLPALLGVLSVIGVRADRFPKKA